MDIKTARQKAAQAWCQAATSKTAMDTDLALAFADILRCETAPLEDALESAWELIANINNSGWEHASAEWIEAASKWQEQCSKILDTTTRICI